MIIGIITYWTSDNNYGQILQAYALQKYLKNQGHIAYLIAYIPQRKKVLELIKEITKCFLYLFTRSKKYEEIFLYYKNKWKHRKRRFYQFKHTHLQKSKKTYRSLKELKKNPPEADIYITGSDQVWNNTACDKENGVWYLDFGNKEVVKVSYAASSGRAFSKEEYGYLYKYLSKFRSIGVRESELLNDIKSSIGINHSELVLDPTLLLPKEEYLSLCAPLPKQNKKKYIFLYILNIQTASEIYWEAINEYRKSKHLDCKIVSSSGYYQAKELIRGEKSIQASIPEWISYINNAEFVITTSFHGVVFCIKFQKSFIAIPLKGKYSKGNNRIFTLLEKLGLSSRVFSEDKSFTAQMEAPIDWSSVNKILEKEKEKSCLFLNNIIS